MMNENSLYIKNLTIGFSNEKSLISNFSYNCKKSELIALIGANGSGKSSLLRTLAGIDKLKIGEIFINELSIKTFKPKELAREIAFLSSEKIQVKNLKVRELIEFGRFPYEKRFSVSSQKSEICETVAIEVGITQLLDNEVDTLSDGEFQKVSLARVLAQQCPILLLDEPAAYLDMAGKHELYKLLQKLAHDRGKTVIVATHDINDILGIADTIWMLKNGEIISDSPPNLIENQEFESFFKVELDYDSEKKILYFR